MKYPALALIILIFMAGCTDNKEVLQTRDGVLLDYKFFEGGWTGVILVHELNGDKSDWDKLTPALEREGISYLAIDLRGHGKSQKDWTTFTDQDFQDMVYDVEAAEKFMERNGVHVKTLLGESVGANVIYEYAVWKQPNSIILLSPGFDYKGLNITGDFGKYKGKTMVVAGTSDTYSKTTADVMVRDQNATEVLISGLKHGKELLPQANVKIIQFINRE